MIECVIGALLAGACCLAQRQHRLERHNFFCFDSSPKPTPASEDCMNTPQLTSRECNEGKKLESLETNANVKVGIEAEMMERTKALRGRSGLDSLCGRPRNGAAFPLERAVANLHNIQPRLRRKSSSFLFFSADICPDGCRKLYLKSLPLQGV